jgi:hypothetical protein
VTGELVEVTVRDTVVEDAAKIVCGLPRRIIGKITDAKREKYSLLTFMRNHLSLILNCPTCCSDC